MIWEGWNVGSVTIRRVRLNENGVVSVQSRRHRGDLDGVIRTMLAEEVGEEGRADGAAVTGPLAASILDLPYLPEPLSIEKAVQGLNVSPDMVLSLGGESFVVYCIRESRVRNMASSNRCAAGSGEFILQQLGRMGLELEQGLEKARRLGKHVPLASRCSVHIKSDATHKLNKGECSPTDIAYTIVVDLAAKIQTLIESTAWPHDFILVCGGLALNRLLLEELRRLLPASRIETLPESPYLEAYGAAVAARSNGPLKKPLAECLISTQGRLFETLPPLSQFLDQVTRISSGDRLPPWPGIKGLLGIDAGSTTTKAALLEMKSGRLIAACYLRTHGNPVQAAGQCLAEIERQVEGCPVKVVQVAVTGSGRELVSVSLGNCLSFNEILAHARAARAAHPAVDTIFEIGGQDAKFISLLKGVPVDYAMNDGCSAGTGSFLEEAAASDMKYATEEIGPLALQAGSPLAFGERCAAFINSEIRTALQGGADVKNILAGLVYSIVKNYLSRVVGTRHIGHTVLLQGGVALNPAVAPAVVSLSGCSVIVPEHPELMGCFGAALMARDLIDRGKVTEQADCLENIQSLHIDTQKSFYCSSCLNRCEIQRMRIGGKTYPFGGLCSRWEMQRRPKTLRYTEGRDLVGLRSALMFETFAPTKPGRPSGRIGLPMALSTYELFPFYTRLLVELGFEVVISRPRQGRRNTNAPFCYPAELLHAAVDDLFAQGIDRVFVPQVREFAIPTGHRHAYACTFTEDSAAVIKTFFADQAGRVLAPEIGLSAHLIEATTREICRMADQFGIAPEKAREAVRIAMEHQANFEKAYQQEGRAALEALEGPIVVMVGRPYVAYNTHVNLSLPRKIASRGFHVIPADLLPFDPPPVERNVWRFTQVALSAIRYAKQRPDTYICFLSCFSCNPDAIIYHRLRHELEGQPFCFLEVDSHTADAGIDTRIGAFLDIIEERRRLGQRQVVEPGSHSTEGWINYSRKKPKIITDAGETVGFDNPRVAHVLLADTPVITSRLFASLYGRMGWRCVVMPFTNAKILQAARQVCSGRECLPFLSMVGKMVLYLENRDPDEVTLFHLLEQEGPCQIGNWFDAVHMIHRRLGIRNAFPVWPRIQNNYLGGGEAVAIAAATAGVLGDLFCEVRSALACLAQDRHKAITLLDRMEDRLVVAASLGLINIELELRRMASELARIPLTGSLQETPRVLLFSGINRIFVDKPIRDFFEKHGILSKTGDISEFLCFYETEPVVRRGFALGRRAPDEHFALRTLVAGLLRNPTSQPRFQALRASMHVRAIELLDHHWRSVMAKSGLVFGPDIHYRKLIQAGHKQVSINGWTEAPCTAGRYLISLEEGAFDGYVNIGAFNCTPANNATAVTHRTAVSSSLPFAVIESDGANITASQLRQLESVAAQCWEQKGKRATHLVSDRWQRFGS